jgi:hypothetical protein
MEAVRVVLFQYFVFLFISASPFYIFKSWRYIALASPPFILILLIISTLHLGRLQANTSDEI